MVKSIIPIIYVIFFISMMCAIRVTVKLYLSGKNYLIAILSAGMALSELIVLSSVIWIGNFDTNVPRTFCIFQGLALQYSAYLQIVSALCFSIHIYQLLVCRKQRVVMQKIYIGSIIAIPIIMTIILTLVSISTNAIKPSVLNCDIEEPVWVRLIGYSGFNFVLTFIGVYLSARAAYEVFRHLDRFKASISSSRGTDANLTTSNNDTNNEVTEISVPGSGQSSSQSESQPNHLVQTKIISYNMTKTAAIRMVLFSCGFALINFLAAIQTVLTVIKGSNESESKGLDGNDFAGAFMGTVVYLVFGFSGRWKGFKGFRKDNNDMVNGDNC